ncbi:MAG TPA: amino acid ABC transporter permease [Propionibacteriaceae bacterium]
MNQIWQMLGDNSSFLLNGVLTTVGLTILGFVGALLIGTIVAVFRVSPITPLRVVGTIYVEFFRNVPLLTLLILIVFGLPDIGMLIPLFWCGVLGLVLAGSAFICETVRSGINTISVGQSEAARALGMSFGTQLRLIILPQAFRTMVQPLVNNFIGILIGSSLASAVGVSDITNVTQQLNIRYAEAVVLFLLSGAVYLVFALGAGGVGSWLERLVSKSRIGSAR